MKIVVLYIGSSLLAPLKNAERDINREYELNLALNAYNFGAALSEAEWASVEHDLKDADVVFVIHVMDGENAARLIPALDKYRQRHAAVIVINCMPELMRHTHMGRLDVSDLLGTTEGPGGKGKREKGRGKSTRALGLLSAAGSWVGRQVGSNKRTTSRDSHGKYLKLVDRLPTILKFVPGAGKLRDVKNYLNIFCYFLQPTPANIRAMLLYALKEYVSDDRLKNLSIKLAAPEHLPSVAIYHPDSPKLFENFADYEKWYAEKTPWPEVQAPKPEMGVLDPRSTVGLLLMRPQVISKTTAHYDALIRAIEAEGLSVIPALSTLMDNREASEKFFVNDKSDARSKVQGPKSKVRSGSDANDNGQLTAGQKGSAGRSRVSQIVSLTGFSFVGGPAMNDSEAASEFLQNLNRPYRSAVSLDMQKMDAWQASLTGLNPVQAGMQIAIPEIDGATEPFIFGGIPGDAVAPVPLDERCTRLARRLKRWNRLRTAPRDELKLALVLFCFPPNKGNIGTAADLDVFPSVWESLERLKVDGYDVDLPASPEALRDQLIGGNAETFASTAHVAYRMSVSDYRQLCPYVDEIECDWGSAPGRVNSFGRDLLIQGIQLGKVFVGVQPTFGYEGDPMRLMMARSGSPPHGFMAFYTYLSKVLDVDAAIHVGTHGAMEFMPGKQVGLSTDCWPDRLIGELPNIYLYSVNNPSEGSIAKRRSYAELISYLTPPIENAGLYKELNLLKDLVMSYREAREDEERERLFESIADYSARLNLDPTVVASVRL